jgi:hypothetical protein
MTLAQPLANDIPHLLEWQASYCATLAETSKRRRTRVLLRLLAVDLAIEAERSRWRDAEVGRHPLLPRGADLPFEAAQWPADH